VKSHLAKHPSVILVVEDAPDCRESLEIALEGLATFSVKSVISAEQALQLFQEDEVCAVITDLNLPEMDGVAMIQDLRARPTCAKLPIVVTSGDTTDATRARLAQLRIDAFFAKPYSPGEVRKTLLELIQGSRSNHALPDESE
jgi:CheY-like chemotaxis protein